LSPWTWLAAALTVGYVIFPIDVMPEAFLGPIGFLDDVGVMGVLGGILKWELNRFENALGQVHETTAERVS